MEKLEKLLTIANDLGLTNVVSDLQAIKLRATQENADIILPLVGEFSSGKTTLINALTDSKKLETAIKPTTATIYAVHFGCDVCCATVVNKNGEVEEISDLEDLKNDALADAQMVTVFDTSKRVSCSTVLVDTPGLSSPDPKHKQTLANCLPMADGLLLVVDINQQVTRSLTDFIDTMKLSKRPIFCVLTHTETKSRADIDAVKKQISENCQVPLQQIAAVSAVTNSLDELYAILNYIQKDKQEILKKVDEQRINNIIKLLSEHIAGLLSASASDNELSDAIKQCENDLRSINRKIDNLVESLSDDIEEEKREVSRRFEDIVYEKLYSLVTGNCDNFDANAVSIVNSTATILMNDYRNAVHTILRKKANSQSGSENELSMSSLGQLDLSSLQMPELHYNLNLNEMGHQHDGKIKVGLLAAAAIAALVVIKKMPAGTAEASKIGAVLDAADTVTDVGTIISNQKSVSRMERLAAKASEFQANSTKIAKNYDKIADYDRKMGNQIGCDKGIIDSTVGAVTDKMLSKPQRKKAIRDYVDTSLAPEFKNRLEIISEQLIDYIKSCLEDDASQLVNNKKETLSQLKSEMQEKKELFNKRMEQLKGYQTELLTN